MSPCLSSSVMSTENELYEVRRLLFYMAMNCLEERPSIAIYLGIDSPQRPPCLPFLEEKRPSFPLEDGADAVFSFCANWALHEYVEKKIW